MKKIISLIRQYLFYLVRYRGNKVRYLRSLGARIGDGSQIYSSINGFAEPWLVEIGSNVFLAAGVVLITHDGSSRIFRKAYLEMNQTWGNRFAPIRILDNCLVGLNALVLPGITVGPNSIIGAGSVVTKDVPSNTVVAGNPARPICTFEEYINSLRQTMIPIKAVNRTDLRKELTRHFWGEER